MKKRMKIILIVLTILISCIIVNSSINFIFIPNMQREQIINGFSNNINKFVNIHNYISEKLPYSRIYRNEEFNSSEIKIDDNDIRFQIEYIFKDLDFEYIENIGSDTHFVFKDANGHFQSIDFSTDDMTKINGWNCIKLKDNWYYRSVWKYFLKQNDENDLIYVLRVAFHLLRGY